MKKVKMTSILVLALCLVVCAAKVSEASPMGTAWTYQGQLIDANTMKIVYVESGEHATVARATFVRKSSSKSAQ